MNNIKNYKQLIIGIIIGFTISVTPIFAKTSNVVLNEVNIKVNNQPVSTSAITYNGTVYVPIRAIAEILDKEVVYDSETKTVNINDKGENSVASIQDTTLTENDNQTKDNTSGQEGKNKDDNTACVGTLIQIDESECFTFKEYYAFKLNEEIFVRADEFIIRNNISSKIVDNELYWTKDSEEKHIGNIYNSPDIRISSKKLFIKYDIIKSFED